MKPRRLSMWKFWPDVILVAGAATLVTGLWWCWPPGALMLAGILLIIAGLSLATDEGEKKNEPS